VDVPVLAPVGFCAGVVFLPEAPIVVAPPPPDGGGGRRCHSLRCRLLRDDYDPHLSRVVIDVSHARFDGDHRDGVRIRRLAERYVARRVL
jgi:hypothetical protein